MILHCEQTGEGWVALLSIAAACCVLLAACCLPQSLTTCHVLLVPRVMAAVVSVATAGTARQGPAESETTVLKGHGLNMVRH